MQHCTIIKANTIFSQIENLGLECCKKFVAHELAYDLLEFAYLRRYILEKDAFVADVRALHDLHMKMGEGEIKLFIEYKKEYGSRLSWTDDIQDRWEQDVNREREKHKEKTMEKVSQIVTETLKRLANQEQIQEYAKYINVLFGK